MVCKVTTQELADICHVTRQTISNIENRKSTNKATETLIGLALDGLAQENDVVYVFNALEQGS